VHTTSRKRTPPAGTALESSCSAAGRLHKNRDRHAPARQPRSGGAHRLQRHRVPPRDELGDRDAVTHLARAALSRRLQRVQRTAVAATARGRARRVHEGRVEGLQRRGVRRHRLQRLEHVVEHRVDEAARDADGGLRVGGAHAVLRLQRRACVVCAGACACQSRSKWCRMHAPQRTRASAPVPRGQGALTSAFCLQPASKQARERASERASSAHAHRAAKSSGRASRSRRSAAAARECSGTTKTCIAVCSRLTATSTP
jgi:hypothetical protein